MKTISNSSGSKYAVTQKRLLGALNKGLLLDTPGCQIPRLDPFDPSVKWLIKKKKPFICYGKKIFLFGQENGYEFIKIKCSLGKKRLTQFLPLTPLKPTLKETSANETSKLNIILLAIDSVSKLNFLRHFPLTQKVLKKISPFELHGYTKVGDNTFPNMIPFLSGKSVTGNIKIRNIYYDNLDIIWKRFATLNYTTYYAEDNPKTGTFNYLKKGFRVPPTDYYFRPMALALENSQLRRNRFCFNSQLDVDIMYDYLRNFVQTMNNRAFFAFNFISTMSHDELNTVGFSDYPTSKLLHSLWKAGTFNKTVLIFFSDHGIRFGKIRETYIGKFEERMPFIYIHLPDSFLSKNPHVATNLRVNQERLTTPFDIHATLLHMWTVLKTRSNTVGTDPFKTKNGVSLLSEISENRTCEDAHILPHWCVCQTFHPVSNDGEEAVNCALSVVEEMNAKLSKYKTECAELKLQNILSVILRLPNERVLRFIGDHYNKGKPYVEYGEKINTVDDYVVTLSTYPSGGIFEGTVRNSEKGVYNVLGISRINAYGNQSVCIDDQELQIFCYCTLR
ncbi:uncharacterized protein LOC129226843 [Uloborus diversus]|uniref:uncharacterized protein LOC129226843 n=1 Tax=Uloborus diversus TaxID=327109 RepID=UPI0024092260|nr:uncharacterized protein LOC129226843 [Uloborus diversus]